MPRKRHRYTKELLEPIVKRSQFVSDVLRELELRIDGNTHSYVSKRIRDFGIDTSHFKPAGFYLQDGSKRKIVSKEILVNDRLGRRERSWKLRRALLESGREYKCVCCPNTGKWNGKPILLEIDHINEDGFDNRAENLQFLCPNCHSQKTNPNPKLILKQSWNERYKKDTGR